MNPIAFIEQRTGDRITGDEVMLENFETISTPVDAAQGQPERKGRMFTRLYDKIRETPMWLPTANGNLYAVECAPQGSVSRPPVVIAAPDGEEHAWAVRTLVTVARALAHHGSMVYRFDYLGQGESEGEFEATTWHSRLADLEAAVELAHGRTGRTPVVLGVRLGATLALAAAVKRGTPMGGLVVWEPVVDAAQYVHQLLRVNVSSQMVALGRIERDRSDLIAYARRGGIVSVNGFGLSGPFIDALLALDVDSTIGQLRIPTLWLSSMAADQTVQSNPAVVAKRVPTFPFWKEPKVHRSAPPSFLVETAEWLASDRYSRGLSQ
jgi:alpha/beta superfamily hydrolase